MISAVYRNLFRIVFSTMLMMLAAAALPVVAQASEAETPGFKWGFVARYGADDNVYRAESDEQSDTFVAVQPQLAWVMLSGANQFDVAYTGDYGVYQSEDNLNFNNHKIGAHALLDHTARLNTDWVIGFERGREDPGTNDIVFQNGDRQNEWENAGFQSTIEYGNSDSNGQLVGKLRLGTRRFTNNEQNFRDFDSVGATGTFYYRIAPRTRLLFEVDVTEDDYQNQDIFGSDQSNREYRYLTGVAWEATAQTSGAFRIGYRDRQFDNNLLGELDGLYFALDGRWQPTTFTSVRITASRDNQNSAQQATGGFVRTAFETKLEHGLSARLRLTSSIGYSIADFKRGIGNQNRRDDRWNLALGMEYDLLDWLDIGAEYLRQERDSDLNRLDFSAGVFLLSVSTKFSR